ncbi:MAG: hypothetical protein LIP09_13660 [Bacteroidales bacterium]|nr:hypothetical protein [Bacteroidales bacterium]
MKVRKILGMLSVWILVLACCGIPQEAMAKKNAIKDLEKQYKKKATNAPQWPTPCTNALKLTAISSKAMITL